MKDGKIISTGTKEKEKEPENPEEQPETEEAQHNSILV